MDFPRVKRRKLDEEGITGNSACSSESSDGIPDSCCSSSRSTSEEDSAVEELEPSTYSSDCRQRGETKDVTNELQPELGEIESSTENRSMESSLSKFESEIEEFFLAEEQHLLEQFSDKYNFDFANEKPMEGRFEWVKLKP